MQGPKKHRSWDPRSATLIHYLSVVGNTGSSLHVDGKHDCLSILNSGISHLSTLIAKRVTYKRKANIRGGGKKPFSSLNNCSEVAVERGEAGGVTPPPPPPV
jgi:hypothetical protein